ncbi:MAG: hypothetical protein GF388_00350 [Candidatus Aegiribacteria sp.]|nr:hypothetical protein [Candidatus Aegiribacteria sp.]
MTDLVAILGIMLSATVSTRSIPRFDGLLLELSSNTPICDSISVNGYSVRLRPGSEVILPETLLPFWVKDWELDQDSCGILLDLNDSIDSLEYSLSGDSLTMLVFFRASSAVEFPELSWIGPPEETLFSDTITGSSASSAVYADSSVLTALESGRGSPWLEDFDCVVIDPGHGGRDPGAVGPSGTYEKDRALEIALLVRDILQLRRPDLEVVMTRDYDRYCSLGERTRLANTVKADLFVSIHCNAATRSSANGFETFFLSSARTDDARAVEMLENSVIEYEDESALPAFQDNPLSFLLADIAQNIYLERSNQLAVEIQHSLESSFPSNISRGVKQAGFYVLRGALMPSVLIEVAFISNPEEERLLQTLDFRLAAAEAIVGAVLEFAEQQDGGT